MPATVVIFSYGSIFNGAHQPYSGIATTLDELRKRGVKVGVTSNSLRDDQILASFDRAKMARPDALATNATTGQLKPSPVHVTTIADALGATIAEVVYIGDKTATDDFCAINAKVMPFAAGWAGNPGQYSIRIEHPDHVVWFYDIFLSKTTYWEYCLDDVSPDGKPLVVCSLAFVDWHKYDMWKVFKDQLFAYEYRGKKMYDFVMMHFLSSLFLSGMAAEAGLCTVYPSSTVGKPNVFEASGIISYLNKTFRSRFLSGLLVRHMSVPSRKGGASTVFSSQPSSVHINPLAKVSKPKGGFGVRLKGKTVLVIDDYNTCGHAFENARMYLYKAEVEKVICISMSKYPKAYEVQTTTKEFDPYAPNSFAEADFKTTPRMLPCMNFLPMLEQSLDMYLGA